MIILPTKNNIFQKILMKYILTNKKIFTTIIN